MADRGWAASALLYMEQPVGRRRASAKLIVTVVATSVTSHEKYNIHSRKKGRVRKGAMVRGRAQMPSSVAMGPSGQRKGRISMSSPTGLCLKREVRQLTSAGRPDYAKEMADFF
jgi:hypothetical protein